MKAAIAKAGRTHHKFVPQSYATDIKPPEKKVMNRAWLWKDLAGVAKSMWPANRYTRMLVIGAIAGIATSVFFKMRHSRKNPVEKLAKIISR